MKILVTGGAGFIGSHVVDLFVERGHEVVVVDNLSTGRLSNLRPEVKHYQVDLRSPDAEQVFQIEHPDVIDHHAAQINVRKSVGDPAYDADINVMGAIHLLQLAVKYQVRKVIYSSSGGAVYGEPVYLPCDENHPIRPLCPYGATKYMVEMYLYMYRQLYGLDYSILRYANVYGPRQDPKGEAGVISIFVGNMLDGCPVTINGSGEQLRDFVYVEDCARANLMVLEQGSGQVFNVGTGVATSIIDLFRMLRRIAQFPHDAVYSPAKAGETFQIYLDASRAREELGWQPMMNLEEGLSRTVEYFKLTGSH